MWKDGCCKFSSSSSLWFESAASQCPLAASQSQCQLASSAPDMATQFPEQVCGGIKVFVGGRADALSLPFLKGSNIRLVVCATGNHNREFDYPVAVSDEFRVLKLPIGFSGEERTRCNMLANCKFSKRAHNAM